MTVMRLGQRPRVLLTILATLTTLTLLGSLSACALDSANGNGAQTASTPTVAAPVTTPTPSKPTIPQSATTLGGSVVSFDKKFGASNCCFENGWNYQGPFGKQIWTGVNVSHTPYVGAPDEGSTQRVIDIETSGLNVTMTQAKSFCGSFLPSDAKVQHTTAVSSGTELRYTSVLLANTLPASDFTDKNGKATPPGTIFVYYYNSSGTVDSCTLSTDESLILLLS